MLINRRVRLLRRVELINDVDRLRSHAHLRHERVERDDLFLLQAGLRDQIIELNPEHDLAFSAQLRAELLRHRREVLLLVQRLPEQLSQLGVNRFRIIVTQKTKAGVDLFLHDDAIGLRETRQHLDQQRQQVGPLGDTARLAQGATHQTAPSSSHAIRKRDYPLHGAVDLIGHR